MKVLTDSRRYIASASSGGDRTLGITSPNILTTRAWMLSRFSTHLRSGHGRREQHLGPRPRLSTYPRLPTGSIARRAYLAPTCHPSPLQA